MRTSMKPLVFSAHPLRTLFFVLPLAILFALAAAPSQAPWPLSLVAGILWWSFAEYAFHRWLYHWRPRWQPLRNLFDSIHLQHHRDIADRRLWNAGPFLAIPIAVL